MDALNSRRLTAQDGFAHPFQKAGEFTFSALASHADRGETTGIIIVSGEGAPDGRGKQFDVLLRWDAAALCFVAATPETRLELRPNDFVMFQFGTALPGQPSCAISVRQQDRVECDSRAMRTHDAFIHFFMQPGEYAYTLGDRRYRISVADHRTMPESEHQRQAAQPVVILVNGHNASVPHAHVVAGQSVVWAMEQADGVQIVGLDPV
jgi:hypothetical protein